MNKNQPSLATKALSATAFFGLVVLFFTACAQTAPVACQEVDWYELGRQDGAKGHTGENLKGRRQVTAVCEDSDPSLNEAFYNNGFDAGVAQYCSPQNGFELGHAGLAVADICPPLAREDFTQHVEQGRRLAQIENEKQNIDTRLLALNKQSALEKSDKSVDIARRGLLNGEKLELLQKKKLLEQSATNIGAEHAGIEPDSVKANRLPSNAR